MSAHTTTSHTTTTSTLPDDPTPAALPVAGQAGAVAPTLRTGNERVMWAALENNPGFTAPQLADVVGMAVSTAQRMLSAWAKEGAAHRDRDPGNPRAAGRWRAIVTVPDVAEVIIVTLPDLESGTGTTEPDATATTGETTDIAETAPAPPNSENTGTATELDPESGTDPGPDTTGDPATEQPAPAAEPEIPDPTPPADATPTGGEPADPARAAAPADAGSADGGESPLRLVAGALRGQVEDWLRDHPDQEFTPHEIGKALARSSGAVHNALVKLTTEKVARQTGDKPKKFALA